MFYVIDISWFRKYIQNKYNDIMLDCKLSTPKVNKALIAAVVVGIVILVGNTTNAAGVIDKAQYNFLLDHYVSDLKYPKGLAERLIKELSLKDFNELSARVEQHDKWMKFAGNQMLDAGNYLSNKVISGIKEMYKFYGRLR